MKNRKNQTRVIDFFLLLLAFFSVIGLAQRFGAFQNTSGESLSAYTVEVFWENIDFETANCLSVGEQLKTETGALFGVVEEIRRVPHEAVFHREGRELRAAWPEGTVEDLELTVSIRGRKNDNLLLREDGSPVLLNQRLQLYSLRAGLSLRVISIE